MSGDRDEGGAGTDLGRDRSEPPQVDATTELEQPGGLLGLLLWPLRAAISLALRVFALFVKGVLGAIFPALRDPEQDGEEPPPR